MTERETLIEFPCRFPVKVMGDAHPELMEAVEGCVAEHLDADDAVIEQRASRAGRYVGITITFTATSQEQLDAFYRSLGRCDRVRMIL